MAASPVDETTFVPANTGRRLYLAPRRSGKMASTYLAPVPCRHAEAENLVMSSAPVLHSIDARGVATVTLNRPEVGNAYNGELIQGLLGAIDDLGARPGLRALLLAGNGKHFQAGADLAWVRSISAASTEENVSASRATAEAVDRLNRLPVPTIALVQGGCFGGGTGILAACDVVIAADNAIFSIAEVRWGLTAAIILPQLSDAISVRQLRRYALTGERFGAAEAQRIGLAHQVVPLDRLAAAGEEMIARVLENGPIAMAQTKALALQSAWGGVDAATMDALVDSHAAKRRSLEAAEGLASFAEKRAARWSRG
jgi:methylglutaconyl-CoA hydratase